MCAQTFPDTRSCRLAEEGWASIHGVILRSVLVWLGSLIRHLNSSGGPGLTEVPSLCPSPRTPQTEAAWVLAAPSAMRDTCLRCLIVSLQSGCQCFFPFPFPEPTGLPPSSELSSYSELSVQTLPGLPAYPMSLLPFTYIHAFPSNCPFSYPALHTNYKFIKCLSYTNKRQIQKNPSAFPHFPYFSSILLPSFLSLPLPLLILPFCPFLSFTPWLGLNLDHTCA